ncbi:hypothetical protein BKP45_12355 [Anaerobacillus alkalidiazotrophicus]|uniref:Dihydrofolate synthase/folylpolyglutamate synthase n=1 Tax=Anaerobacillus alkalidiazotrophicus TaxID=472963 RepID=A0A1S2M5Q9_9BACI|nr:folylpolyglutamate synthase/dihydrofolate synthase family protein [Anaerobacillus alkalidiazotrophicus]OIJ18361.1 hypothetical protein BKP45_18070 [Anaerobacillus alkalidiazotrophicus]OIJ19840.1 hypothetical protein BKP45_12355 [Anaerobacillus alkalidiazotrophicus]
MISYDEACNIVNSASKFGICLGLERMEEILVHIGSPEKKIPAIHLAGTNGKGSTLTYLKSIFTEAGYSVGTFTSPAIRKINDKIQVNDKEIPDSDFALIVEQLSPIINKIKRTSLGAPTEFEIMTAVAFQYFATKAKPDIVLIETGLGGRLDSTNVIQPLVSIITNIGHDHMDILGHTIEAVAQEKAGIIKQGVPVVSGCKQSDAIEVMKKKAKEASATLYQFEEDFTCDRSGDHFSFQYKDYVIQNLKTGMLGSHQQENAALALMAICILEKNGFQVGEKSIRNGLVKAKIANRIEIVQEQPTIIFDGGHNPEGMEALATTLANSFPSKSVYILFCAMKDKNIKDMLKPISTFAKEIILTSFLYDRSMDPHQVYEECSYPNSKVIENVSDAYDYLGKELHADDVLVVTGSLYFLNYFRNECKK